MSDGRQLVPKSLNVTHTWVDIRLLNGIKTPRTALLQKISILRFYELWLNFDRIAFDLINIALFFCIVKQLAITSLAVNLRWNDRNYWGRV